MKEQSTIATIKAEEGKTSIFNIFRESGSPYSSDKAQESIELEQAKYIGGDLYVIPMQVYKTENPLLLKVIYLVADLWWTPEGESRAEITGNNIRVGEMTTDGKLLHKTPGERDLDGKEWAVVDLIKHGPARRLDSSELRSLCIKENWFTSGDVRQYEMLFQRNSEGASIEELAAIIWICSSSCSREEIYAKLVAAYK